MSDKTNPNNNSYEIDDTSIDLKPFSKNPDDYNFIKSFHPLNYSWYLIDPNLAIKANIGLKDIEDVEAFSDSLFGKGEWGFVGEYAPCKQCDAMLTLEAFSEEYEEFLRLDNNEFLCMDCILKNPAWYINYLINNTQDYNKFLSTKDLERHGFIRVPIEPLSKHDTRDIYRTFLRKYPTGEFILNIVIPEDRYYARESYTFYARNAPIDPNYEIDLYSLKESKADTQKFIAWGGKSLSDKFFKLKSRLETPENDIYYWMKRPQEELIMALNKLEDTPTRKQKDETAKAGATLIYEDEDWYVYEILTPEASIKYGKGTLWCISAEDCGADEMWSNYKNNYKDFPAENSKFIFFINKTFSDKYAVRFNTKTKNYLIWNEVDLPVKFILDAPKVPGLPDFGKVPADLKYDIAQSLKIPVNNIISIVNCYKELYPKDKLEKYSVEYKNNQGIIVIQDLYRNPKTDLFAPLEIDEQLRYDF